MFYSALFENEIAATKPRIKTMPAYFKDLNLDQVIEPILKRNQAFELAEYFFTTIDDETTLLYRQAIMQDLEQTELQALLKDFAKTINAVALSMEDNRKALSSNDHYTNNYLTRGNLFHCVETYCEAIIQIKTAMNHLKINSEGLKRFQAYLDAYCTNEEFLNLQKDAKQLREQLNTIHYCMLIEHGTVRVRKYEGQIDYAQKIIQTFAKFGQGEVKDYRHRFSEKPYASHVEAAILDLVAKLYKDIFKQLEQFCLKYNHFEDAIIINFAREIQFYLAWLDYIEPFKQQGLKFNYPTFSLDSKHLFVEGGYDLALAKKVGNKIVVNDFELNYPESIIVITGPNQGGKTTFARMFAQLHYFAELGLCIPGERSQLYLFDQILTHFEIEEDLMTLNGKLKNELIRLKTILNNATRRSIIIINEIFASTTLDDAKELGHKMLDALSLLGAPTVIVTFVDELADNNHQVVSMMSTVNSNDQSRTFKIIRKHANGQALAMSIVERHGLTYAQIKRRLSQ